MATEPNTSLPPNNTAAVTTAANVDDTNDDKSSSGDVDADIVTIETDEFHSHAPSSPAAAAETSSLTPTLKPIPSPPSPQPLSPPPTTSLSPSTAATSATSLGLPSILSSYAENISMDWKPPKKNMHQTPSERAHHQRHNHHHQQQQQQQQQHQKIKKCAFKTKQLSTRILRKTAKHFNIKTITTTATSTTTNTTATNNKPIDVVNNRRIAANRLHKQQQQEQLQQQQLLLLQKQQKMQEQMQLQQKEQQQNRKTNRKRTKQQQRQKCKTNNNNNNNKRTYRKAKETAIRTNNINTNTNTNAYTNTNSRNANAKIVEHVEYDELNYATNSKEQFLLTLDLLAVVRRNASDKLKLIQMVHDNPILWDSRLPNFKGAEEEKNRAWEQIGKEFSAPGRRVARAFKSLRESYRRELAHVKLMGSTFKPKWGLFDAMDFLRDVIRERKGGSHAAEQAALGFGTAFSQHIANNNNNNNNTNNNNVNISSNGNTKAILKFNALHHSTFNEAALNLTKSSALNLIQDNFYPYVTPEIDLTTHGNGVAIAAAAAAAAVAAAAAAASEPVPAHNHQQQQHHNAIGQLHHQQQQQLHQHNHQQQQQQQQEQQHSPLNGTHDSRVSSTRNDNNNSTQNAVYDDLDATSLHSGDGDADDEAHTALSHNGSDEVEELEAIDADFPYPLILDGSSRASGSAAGGVGGGGSGIDGGNSGGGCNGSGGVGGMGKRRRREIDNSDIGLDCDDDDDDYEGQMLQQHRKLRQQNGGVGVGGLLGLNGMMMDMMPQPQTVREVLNTKFCGFISAKLNSMDDTEADNLMNKILMLLVQTQSNETK